MNHDQPRVAMKLLLLLAAIVGLPLAQLAVDESFKEDCLQIHNYYRNLHQVANVTWSDRMESFATNWTQYLADNNLFKHSSRRPGNLYMSRSKPTRICTTAIRMMYTEEKYYNYSRPGYQARAGHFTQIVWKNTKYIGADWKLRKDGRLVVAIKYDPMGNWASAAAYRKNVFPPLFPTTDTPTIITTTSATTTTFVPTTNLTTNSTNGSSTAQPTTRRKLSVLAGNARATASGLVLAGSLVIVLAQNLAV